MRRKASTRALFKQFKTRLDTYLVNGHPVNVSNFVGLQVGLEGKLPNCSQEIFDKIRDLALDAHESGWTIEEADSQLHRQIKLMMKDVIAFHVGLEAIYKEKDAYQIVQHQIHIIMLALTFHDADKATNRHNINLPETNRLFMSKDVINHMLLNAQGQIRPRWLEFFRE